MDISPGKQLGRLEILSEIQAGGPGEFFHAKDTKSDQDVGVRVLPMLNGHPIQFDRLHYAAAGLKHPNILGIRGLRSKLGMSYVITEAVEGNTLRSVMRRGPVPLHRLLDIATQMADGLSAAHRAGVPHGALTPETVIVDRENHVRILDFALIRQAAGSPEYKAPEQLRGDPADARSDLFSFGVILYEMAVGHKPFDGNSPQQITQQILHETPPEPPSSVAPKLVEVIGRCLEKNPADRFASAPDLSAALEHCYDDQPAAAVSVEEKPTRLRGLLGGLKERRLNWNLPSLAAPQQRWLLWALGAIALLLLAALIYRARTRVTQPTFERISYRQGSILRARFMPDGKSLIYTARFEGSPQATYLNAPGSLDARDLNLPEGSAIVAVSSKGDLAIRLQNGNLVRRSVSNDTMLTESDNVLDADWAPGGEQLAIAHYVAVARSYRVEYPIGKTLNDTDGVTDLVRISPDGDRVAFTAMDKNERKLWVVSRSGSKKMLTVLAAGEGTRTLSWSPDGSEIWFGAITSQERGIIRAVNLSGKTREVSWIPESHLDDVASDGRALVEVFRTWSGLWFEDLTKFVERDLSWHGETTNSKLSGDGRRVLFTEYEGTAPAAYNIYSRRVDGSDAVRIGEGSMVAASPDGNWVTAYRASPPRYYLLATHGHQETLVLIPGLEHQSGPVVGWLPNGRSYVVYANQPGKEARHFVWSPADQDLKPVSPEGTGLGLVSEDGMHVLAPGPDHVWYVFSSEGGNPKPAQGMRESDRLLRWSPEGAFVYVVASESDDRKFSIYRVNPATGSREPWKEIRPPFQADNILPRAISPDGSSILYAYFNARSELFLAKGLK